MSSAHKLVVIPNFIDSDDLREIADLLSKAKIKKLEHSTVKYDGKAQRYINLPSGTIVFCDNDALYKTIDRQVSRIKEEIERSFSLEVYPETRYAVTAYVKGDELIGHFDGAEQVLTPGGHPHRDISSVLYLNDDYTGGVFSFDTQEISINPRAGTLVLFPGTEPFTHSVSILESGLRYIVPMFWAIKNSDDSVR